LESDILPPTPQPWLSRPTRNVANLHALPNTQNTLQPRLNFRQKKFTNLIYAVRSGLAFGSSFLA